MGYGPLVWVERRFGSFLDVREKSSLSHIDRGRLTPRVRFISSGHMEFVQYVLESPQLQHLVNMADNSGETAPRLAERKGKTELVDELKKHKDIDVTLS